MRQKKWTIPALIAGSVLFCVIPYLYQWLTGNTSDWQAWWAFGTFLIALIAAIIAYKEYNAHISATEPLIIVRVAKIKGSALDTIFLTNVGGSIAIDVKFSLSPGIRLKNYAGVEYLARNLPKLKPDEETIIIDAQYLTAVQLLVGSNRSRQILHVEWKDALGRQYVNDNQKLDFGIYSSAFVTEK